MGIFSIFRTKQAPSSASLAKERLQVVIAHERTDRGGPDYLPMLRKDILEVIRKYVDIDEEQVSVQLDSQDNCDVLELNITLPDVEGDDAAARAERLRKRASAAKADNRDRDDGPDDGSTGQGRARAAAKAGKRPRRRTSNPV